MSHYSEGQTHQFMDALEAKGFTPTQVTALGQNSELLGQIQLVLMGLATVVRACFKFALDKTLDPATFIGEGWTFWKGPVDGNGLEGDEDYVSEPDVVDFEQIILEMHLQGKETSVHGEEKMKRARASKNRQQGDKAFLALWNDWLVKKAEGKPEDSILERLRRSGKIGNIAYFFGCTLRDPDGYRYVLYLYFIGREWSWDYDWLDDHWDASAPSLALASV